jgi:hypothetical protein
MKDGSSLEFKANLSNHIDFGIINLTGLEEVLGGLEMEGIEYGIGSSMGNE